MTSPRHAESTALGRYYTHPTTGQQLISVTNALSVAMAKPALVPWAAKIAAEYAMDHMPTLIARSRTDRDGALRDIKTQITVARDKAADLGTRIHALAEAHVTGRQMSADPEAAPYVAQYEAFLRDFGVDLDRDVEAAEMTVAHPSRGYAGTLDLILHLPIGYADGKPYPLPDGQRQRWMVDLKTSATRPATSVYPEYALQLTALRNCREAWLPNDTTEPIGAGVSACAVLNLRPTTYALIPMPCGDTEWATFLGVLAVASWVHADPVKEARPVTPAGRVVPKRSRKVA